MSDLVATNQIDDVFHIILNRPDKRNAVNMEMLHALDHAVKEVAKSDARVVIIRGEGGAFSAGIDLSTLMGFSSKYGENWVLQMRTITDEIQSVLTRMERLEKPTILVAHGYCLGLGMELALACDLRIMTDDCAWGLPETRLGIIPDVGGTTRLTRLVGYGRAKEIIFTGKRYDAEWAGRWGIANYVVPEEKLSETVDSLVNEIKQAAPLAVGMAKRVIDGMADLDRGLQLEGWAQSQLMGTEDFLEAAQAVMMKRQPEFKGK